MPENLKPRRSAVRILSRVLMEGQTVDEAIFSEKDYETYSDSDRHFIRLLILTTLRRLGQIDAVLERLLKHPLSKKQQTVRQILRLAVAQKIFLQTPDYAVVNTSVSLTKKFHMDGLAGLVNGVLRQLGRLDDPLKELQGISINFPKWLIQSWQKAYGSETVSEMLQALMEQPPLDISVPKDAAAFAKRWNGVILPTGSIRVKATSPDQLIDFQTSGCWVQNAAASVPAQLLQDISGKTVADLCAAPGGKTAQLACRGGHVTAIDISEKRMDRLKENINRLGLAAQVQPIVADILEWNPGKRFDAVLLDAPCSATGTIARHPEIKYHRTPNDIRRLSELQVQLLKKAIDITKPGGEIVFSTCSLQPEEGDKIMEHFIREVDILVPSDNRWKPYLTDRGSLRFLPSQGTDGFYACLMRKKQL